MEWFLVVKAWLLIGWRFIVDGQIPQDVLDSMTNYFGKRAAVVAARENSSAKTSTLLQAQSEAEEAVQLVQIADAEEQQAADSLKALVDSYNA